MINGCWSRESQFSLRMLPLLGDQHSTEGIQSQHKSIVLEE